MGIPDAHSILPLSRCCHDSDLMGTRGRAIQPATGNNKVLTRLSRFSISSSHDFLLSQNLIKSYSINSFSDTGGDRQYRGRIPDGALSTNIGVLPFRHADFLKRELIVKPSCFMHHEAEGCGHRSRLHARFQLSRAWTGGSLLLPRSILLSDHYLVSCLKGVALLHRVAQAALNSNSPENNEHDHLTFTYGSGYVCRCAPGFSCRPWLGR